MRFAAPGLFRLALALLVFVHHVSRLNIGSAAVYIFFVLSGYWICTMWTVRYSKTRASYLTYLISRTWRLLPVFMLCSAITWVVLFSIGSIPNNIGSWFHQATSNLLLLGYNGLSFKPNVPSWSLDIEMQFYIIAPLLIILMSRSLWMLLVCALLSFGAYLLNATVTVAPFLIFFAIGVAAGSSKWRPDPRLAWGSLGVTLALIVLCIAGPFKGVLLGGANPGPLFVYNGAASVVVGLMMAPWALYTTGCKSPPSDRMYGDLSFIVYLLHWPVLRAITRADSAYGDRFMAIGEALIVVMIGSWLIWRLFDHPINKLRSNWVAGRLTPSARPVLASAA
jgi:peptidoglycan/LPS O-acetylase OafA/YrhL